MEFRILGPLEVIERGRPLALGGIKQRSLLAVLLQHVNEVVSIDRLVSEVWGDVAPAAAVNSVHVYVSRLRKQLGSERLATRPPGYALRVEPGELDALTFERLRERGRPREALAMWRGPPFADLAYEPCVQAERARLGELRLVTLEERIDADLAAGRHADLTGELEALIVHEPLRERLRGQLMLALYRSARQAEALAVYRATRRELFDGLGLEPGGELTRMERAILQQDPALDLGRPVDERAVPEAPAGTSLLVAPSSLTRLDDLLALAGPLAAPTILACIVSAAEVGAATEALAACASELPDARAAAFSSPAPGEDLVRLATREACELLLMDAGEAPLKGRAAVVLAEALCDVALLAGAPRAGPVLVPFGAGEHDWAALELGVRVARATGAPLRLIGAAGSRRRHGRDATRLLADASLIIQRRSGVIAEPVLVPPGRRGVLALADDAGLLVVGLPDRWREDGLGHVRAQFAHTPTVFVRRGAGPETPPLTRFTWSLTGSAS